jgi:hypothetical protein
MNIKRIMKFEYVIDVMPSIARGVMKWINVRIVVKLSVLGVVRFVVVNFVDVVCVKIVLLLVGDVV